MEEFFIGIAYPCKIIAWIYTILIPGSMIIAATVKGLIK
jgi:hypothetical protein